ncbi:MAG: putative 4-hydroxybenzoate polyprenyltransferase [Phycisphaerae bacterium]|nr:putative 4-hydroxybenzoate polyprenyltransferase [Phycisphaerae bacterium]
MSTPVPAAASRWVLMARDIKLSHSVFALPFALLAAFLAADHGSTALTWKHLALVIAAMFFARSFAMLANRYADRQIDAANPRTAERALPSGRLRSADVTGAMAACAVALALVAGAFGILFDNWWPLIFTPPVLLWLGLYGLIKRWTLLCHFFLGGALALSPVAAALAIDPLYLATAAPWWLAGFVLLWVAGFDIIYALQDQQVDREQGLHSIPARLGREGALVAAKTVHLLAFVALVMTHRSAPPLGTLFFAGMVAVGLLLAIEHAAATRGRFSLAFFTANGLISLLLGGLGIADILMR